MTGNFFMSQTAGAKLESAYNRVLGQAAGKVHEWMVARSHLKLVEQLANETHKLVPVVPVTGENLVNVNRSIRPAYPSSMKEVMDLHLEASGPASFDCSALNQWLHEGQDAGPVKGDVIYEYLKKNDLLLGCLGLRDLEEIQKKGMGFFRCHFQGKAVFGWKSVVRHSRGDLYVPYLIGNDDEVLLYWLWLAYDWSSRNPALRFA